VRAGFFPLDEQLGLREKHWSEGVAKLVVWLSGQLSFEQVEAVLERVGQMHVSRNSAWRQAHRWGEALRQAEGHAQTEAGQVETRGGVVPGEAGGAERLGVSLDGFMLNIRAEGWKEVKIGSVFRVEKGQKVDETTQEALDVGQAVGNSYVAYLGGPDGFGEKLWAEAKRRQWTTAAETQVVADGAVWIWNLAADHFYDSVQVVDWYHAKSHLAHAAQLLYGEGTPRAVRWLTEQETRLFQGQAGAVATTIRGAASQKAISEAEVFTEAGYFESNKRRMEYLDRRMEGWVIGSGMIESGAKQYQARFKGPGMRWSRIGAERLLPVRTAILSNRFDELWSRVYNLPNN